MSQSNLVTYTKWSPYYGYGGHGRSGEKIENIVVHHMAGNLSVKQCGQVFQSVGASTHYAVNGKNIGQFVKEEDAAWSCGSKWWNQNSISIELANDGGAPNWHVSDQTIATAIKLIADICKRNNIKEIIYTGDKWGNLVMHKWIASTACPGPYLATRFKHIADEVNKILHPQKEGFVKEKGKWHLYENGKKRTKAGWYTYKTRKVYVNKDGALKHYEISIIDGKEYVFAKRGPWVCRNVTTTIRGKWFKSNKDGVVTQHQFWGTPAVYKQANFSLTKKNGCMPTSLAMIVTSLTGSKISPVAMAEYLLKKGAWSESSGGLGQGSKLAAEAFGLKSKYYAGDQYKKALEFMRTHNALMIVRQQGGTFTDGVHYIAIMGVDKDGVALVHNPGSKGSNGKYSFEKFIKPYLRDQKGDKTAATNGAMCIIYK